MKYLLMSMLLLPAFAQAKDKLTYFSCPVKEGRVEVTVKFAIENYDPIYGKGELVTYPGHNEDLGAISVTPLEVGKHYSRMSNLNGQGGDLRLGPSGDIHLFGDGDGYQFTDLVLWNDDSDSETLEGYVRDYGPAYGDDETFKQFIKCKRSSKVL